MKIALKVVLICSMLVIPSFGIFIASDTATGSTLADSSWPSFGNDGQNTGKSEYVNEDEEGSLLWRYKTNGAIVSSPALTSEGNIYFGSTDNYIYGLSYKGNAIFQKRTRFAVYSSPAVDSDGTVYIGSSDNRFYALNPNGSVKWRYTTQWNVDSSPVIGEDGNIYISSYDGTLYSFLPNGTIDWKYSINDWEGSMTSPVIDENGRVYTVLGEDELFAVSKNGKRRWKFSTGHDFVSTPTVGPDGDIYIGCNDGKLYALDQEGSIRWSFETNGSIESSPSVDDKGNIYFVSNDGNLYALDDDGELNWTFSTDGEVRSSPAIDGEGNLFFGSGDENLYSLNSDGGVRWKYGSEGPIYSSPAIGMKGNIYFGCNDSYLYALGEELTYHVPLAPRNPSASSEDDCINVSWEVPADDGGKSIQEFKVYRWKEDSENRTVLGTTDPETTYFKDTSVEKGVHYNYTVTAVNEIGESDHSIRVENFLKKESGSGENRFELIPSVMTFAIIMSIMVLLVLKRAGRTPFVDEDDTSGTDEKKGNGKLLVCPHCGNTTVVKEEEGRMLRGEEGRCSRCNKPIFPPNSNG